MASAQTALASQLAPTYLSQARRSRYPSLIYEEPDASDISLATVQQNALEGWEELCTRDPRLLAGPTTLLSATSTNATNRRLLSAEENRALSANIGTLLRLLRPHFLHPSAHKVLEYLIRRYQVQQYNVNEVLGCALPYHSTNIFVKLIRLLHLKDTMWDFLSPAGRAGTPLPRTVLAQRCLVDTGFLIFVCQTAKQSSGLKSECSAMSSFYTTLVVEALQTCKNVSSDLATRFLPFILHGLSLNIGRDYRAGTLMIIATLIHRVQLSDQVLDDILEGLAKSSSEMLEEVLLLMVQIAHTQLKPHAVFPYRAFTHLARQPALVSILADMGNSVRLEPLLAPMMAALSQRLFAHENYRKLMISIIRQLPIGPLLPALLKALLSLMQDESTSASATTDVGKAESILSTMDELIAAVRDRFPRELDVAVNELLKDARRESPDDERAASVARVLQGWLANTIHRPIEGKHTSIFRALHHSSKTKMRLRALEELHRLARAEKLDTANVRLHLEGVLLQNLAEGAGAKIMQSTLQVPHLHKFVSASRLVGTLKEHMNRVLLAGKKNKPTSLQVDTAVLCARVLADTCRELWDSPVEGEEVDQVSNFLFQAIWTRKFGRRLSRKCAKVLHTTDLPVFQDLEGIVQNARQRAGQARQQPAGVPRLVAADALLIFEAATRVASRIMKGDEESLRSFLKSSLHEPLSAYSSKPRDLGQFAMPLLTLNILISSGILDKYASQIDTLLPLLFSIYKLSWCSATRTEKVCRAIIECPASAQGLGNGQTAPHILLQELVLVGKAYNSTKLAPVVGVLAAHGLYILLGSAPSFVTETSSAFSSGRAGSEPFAELVVLASESPPLVYPLFKPHFHRIFHGGHVSAPPGEAVKRSVHSLARLVLSDSMMASVGPFVMDLLLEEMIYLRNSSSATRAPGSGRGHLKQICSTAIPVLLVACASSKKELRASSISCAKELLLATGDQSASSMVLSLITGNQDQIMADASELSRALGLVVEENNAAAGREEHASSRATSRTHTRGKARNPEVGSYLLELFLALETAQMKRCLLRHIQPAIPDLEVASKTQPLLACLVGSLSSKNESVELSADDVTTVHLVAELLKFYTPRIGGFVEAEVGDSVCQPSLACLTKVLEGPDLSVNVDGRDIVNLKEETLKIFTTEFFSGLPPESKHAALRSLLGVSVHTRTDHISLMSKKILGSLHLDREVVAPFLRWHDPLSPSAGTPVRKRHRTIRTTVETPPNIQTVVAALEMLQDDNEDLSAACCGDLAALLSSLVESDVRTWSATIAPTQDDENLPSETFIRVTYIRNAEHLTLGLLSKISAQGPSLPFEALRVEEIVRCTSHPLDSGIRQAAVDLLGAVAKRHPTAVLDHVLEVLSTLALTVALDNSQAHRAAQECLSAIVPIWISSSTEKQGRDKVNDLLESFVRCLEKSPPHRRLPLARACVESMPRVEGVWKLILLLLRQQQAHRKSEDLSTPNSWEGELAEELAQSVSWADNLAAMKHILLHSQSVKSSSNIQLKMTLLQFASSQLRSGVGEDMLLAEITNDDIATTYKDILHIAMSWLSRRSVDPDSIEQSLLAAILESLQELMPPKSFLDGIIGLLNGNNWLLQKKTLRLISSKAAELGTRSTGTWKDGDVNILANAYLGVCPKICDDTLNASGEESVRRAALLCVKTIVDAFASNASREQMIPVHLQLVSYAMDCLDDGSTRAAALECTVSLVRVLGTNLMPRLNELVAKLIKVAVDEVDAQKALEHGPVIGDCLHQAMVALSVLIKSLGSFLSPHLADLLHLLLSPQVACPSGDNELRIKECSRQAREELAVALVPRILLDPVLGQLAHARERGQESIVVLLEMVGKILEVMDSSAASAYHVKLFDFLLEVLDMRGTIGMADSSVEMIEKCAVESVLALCLKLNEKAFKPIFLQMMVWSDSEQISDEHRLSRRMSFYSIVEALTKTLKNVFVPYFSHFMDLSISLLCSDGPAGTLNRKDRKAKKRKGASTTSEASVSCAAASFRVRCAVVRAFRELFVHDTVGGVVLTEEILNKLRAAIVSFVLELSSLPDNIQEAKDWVSCVVEMAGASGTDVFWKVLNEDLLMYTRNQSAGTRYLALEAVLELINKLREDFLVLLPETLPFLAELLEDSDSGVERKAQEIATALEEISGEDLGEYMRA